MEVANNEASVSCSADVEYCIKNAETADGIHHTNVRGLLEKLACL